MLKRSLTRFCVVSGFLLFVCLLSMTVVMNSLVVTRYVFSYSAPWAEEATRFLMVWLVMLGGAILMLFDDHISLNVFVGKLGPRARLVQAILVRSVVAAVAALTAWTGYGFTVSMLTVEAPGLGISVFWPTLAIPLSMTLITAFALLLIWRDVATLFGIRLRGELPRQSDFMDGSFKPIEDDAEAGHHVD